MPTGSGLLGCAGLRPVFFHARSCTRMTPQEVTHILQDPHAVPDSDDEEDQAQWKVQFLAIWTAGQGSTVTSVHCSMPEAEWGYLCDSGLLAYVTEPSCV